MEAKELYEEAINIAKTKFSKGVILHEVGDPIIPERVFEFLTTIYFKTDAERIAHLVSFIEDRMWGPTAAQIRSIKRPSRSMAERYEDKVSCGLMGYGCEITQPYTPKPITNEIGQWEELFNKLYPIRDKLYELERAEKARLEEERRQAVYKATESQKSAVALTEEAVKNAASLPQEPVKTFTLADLVHLAKKPQKKKR